MKWKISFINTSFFFLLLIPNIAFIRQVASYKTVRCFYSDIASRKWIMSSSKTLLAFLELCLFRTFIFVGSLWSDFILKIYTEKETYRKMTFTFYKFFLLSFYNRVLKEVQNWPSNGDFLKPNTRNLQPILL